MARDLHKEVSNTTEATGQTLTQTLGEIGRCRILSFPVSPSRSVISPTPTSKVSIPFAQLSMCSSHDFSIGNEKKLEKMRLTVDEKLQGVIEKRLGKSFKIVSGRLEAVQCGFGEMQHLTAGVGGPETGSGQCQNQRDLE